MPIEQLFSYIMGST